MTPAKSPCFRMRFRAVFGPTPARWGIEGSQVWSLVVRLRIHSFAGIHSPAAAMTTAATTTTITTEKNHNNDTDTNGTEDDRGKPQQ